MRPPLLPVVLLSLCVALPLWADEKDTRPKEGDKPAEKPAPEKPPEKFVPLGALLGVVQSTGGPAGGLTLKVTFRYLEPNPQAQQNYLRQAQQLMRRQQQILMNRNPAQQQQQMIQLLRDAERLQQSQKDLFRVKSVQKDVELELDDDTKVRSAQPVQQFDDKGNIKRYTPKELKELKGNDKLPGFRAEMSDLQVGQTVLVKVGRRKVPRGPEAELRTDKPAPEESKSRKGPAPQPAPTTDAKLVAILIIIAADRGK